MACSPASRPPVFAASLEPSRDPLSADLLEGQQLGEMLHNARMMGAQSIPFSLGPSPQLLLDISAWIIQPTSALCWTHVGGCCDRCQGHRGGSGAQAWLSGGQKPGREACAWLPLHLSRPGSGSPSPAHTGRLLAPQQPLVPLTFPGLKPQSALNYSLIFPHTGVQLATGPRVPCCFTPSREADPPMPSVATLVHGPLRMRLQLPLASGQAQ